MPTQPKEDRLFETIYLSYFTKMKRFAQEFVISEQDAENIVQDMFTELWEKREMLTDQTIRIAYLFTIIKNKCLNHLRHQMIALETTNKMQEEYSLALRINLDSLEAFDQHIFSDQDIEDLIDRALNSLPPKCKEIFIMNKLEGKKQEQIAAELNKSRKTKCAGREKRNAHFGTKTKSDSKVPIVTFSFGSFNQNISAIQTAFKRYLNGGFSFDFLLK